MEIRAWVICFCVLVLIAVGLGSIGEWAAAAGLVFGWLLFGVLWGLFLGDLFVPTMPRCPDCGSHRSGYRWVCMRQMVSEGAFGRSSPGWVLRDIDNEVSVPVVVPDWTGSVLTCRCPRYWFRVMENWTVYVMTEHAPPQFFAQRRWGRWVREMPID